jgi:hypothetical protein
MAFVDTFKAIPEQFFDVLEVTQQLVLTNASVVLSSAKSLAPVLPAGPFTDRLSSAAGFSDSAFDFAEKVLATQKDFSRKLLDLYAPPKAASPAKAAASKSA